MMNENQILDKKDNIVYKKINAVSVRKSHGDREVEAVEVELQDMKANSVTIVNIKDAEIIEE